MFNRFRRVSQRTISRPSSSLPRHKHKSHPYAKPAGLGVPAVIAETLHDETDEKDPTPPLLAALVRSGFHECASQLVPKVGRVSEPEPRRFNRAQPAILDDAPLVTIPNTIRRPFIRSRPLFPPPLFPLPTNPQFRPSWPRLKEAATATSRGSLACGIMRLSQGNADSTTI